MNFPKKITITELHDNDGYVMANEVVKRYNSHEELIEACNSSQQELKDLHFYKEVYKIVSMVALGLLAISLVF